MKQLTAEFTRLLRGQGGKQRAPILGGRELEVMKIIWREGTLSAQQVLSFISDDSLSLSTMQSTLERLHRKELLHREKDSRRYIYRAAVSRSKVISQLLMDIAHTVGDGEVAPMVSGFVSFIDEESTESVSSEMRGFIDRLPRDSQD